jgi:hypothetical protein
MLLSVCVKASLTIAAVLIQSQLGLVVGRDASVRLCEGISNYCRSADPEGTTQEIFVTLGSATP